jgi:hypothetical protein
MNTSKKVTFTTQHFYNLLDNLYISDQIATFDEDLIDSKKIEYIFNFTKSTPFLSNKTKNYHIQFLNSINNLNESIIKKIDNFVKNIFKILSHKKKILVFCENGLDKSLIMMTCFLIKYYNSNNILEIEDAIRFIKWKTEYSINEDSKNFTILKAYRDFLLKKPIQIISLEREDKKKKIVNFIRNHFSTI